MGIMGCIKHNMRADARSAESPASTGMTSVVAPGHWFRLPVSERPAPDVG